MPVSNLRYPKVFVLDPSTQLITTNTTSPDELTAGQVLIVRPETNVGCGVTPTNVTLPAFTIHQNVGDSKHGTVRTKTINVEKIKGWHAVQDAASVNQTTYIGYDEAVNTKGLTAYKGQNIEIAITLYDNELCKWFGPRGYTHRIVIDLATGCIPCQAECDLLDESVLADWIVDYINGTNAPANSFPVTLELKNYITASKVYDTVDDYGVKLVGKSPVIELIDAANPQQFYKAQLTTFTVGIPYSCPNFPITTTVKAKTGNGYPLEVTDLEKESQGYDRVRDVFEHSKYMKTNFKLRAVDGTKYDFYYLEFDATHEDSGIPKTITDPYVVIFCCPADTGAALEAIINGLVTPIGLNTVDITGGGVLKGTTGVIEL